jgi:high-affinity iron transporter
MLATFVIGLREGLEAALIVGIVAAFLRKNGKSLTALWIGVGLAVILSIAVGVGLDLVERALPQAEQEGMETVIGAIAIFFVTGMIAWMNAHARDMRRELEVQAAVALSHAGSLALAVMAFLAVLKEGFETSVFLLATFSAAQSATLAATGAILGILLAVFIGWGIYVGGVKLNLARFFRVTGVFLILVAAGLVVSALRTAHEAGWLNAGQQATVNLAWLVAPGTVQSALITGVLGIPADPRLIEVLGWCAYLVPVALFICWPQARRPTLRGTIGLQAAASLTLLGLAMALAVGFPAPRLQLSSEAAIISNGDSHARSIGSAHLINSSDGSPTALDLSLSGSGKTSLPLPEGSARYEEHDNVVALVWSIDRTLSPPHTPATLTLDQVVALSAGRVPVGLNPRLHPGPYDANWRTDRVTKVWTTEGVLLDAAEQDSTIVTLSGSGLDTPRVLGVTGRDPALSAGWRIAPANRVQVIEALNALAGARAERSFWAMQLPILIAIAALIAGLAALRNLARLRRQRRSVPCYSVPSLGDRAAKPARGGVHAAD